MINKMYEKEICNYLNIPSIPKKEWDGQKPFKSACGEVTLIGDMQAYAVFGFNEKEGKPFVKKVFGEERIMHIGKIYPVPDYMDMQNIDNWDVDEESKNAASILANEAMEMEQQEQKTPEILNEWYFDEIHNIEEARAWVASYKKRNRIRGTMPKTEETLKSYLYVLYKNQKRGK